MAAAGVVALKLVVNVRGGAELLFKTVSTNQRSRAVHFIKVENFLGDGNVATCVVKLLLDELLAKDLAQSFCRDGLARLGVEQRSGLFCHISAHVVPVARHFAFFQINLVGDFFL